MKVLWMSSVSLTDQKIIISGSWIPGMLSLLKEFYPDIQIINLTKGDVGAPKKIVTAEITEWIIPKSGKMTAKVINDISAVINSEAPDVIQIWGTEDFWGLYPFDKRFPLIPVILEIQGILASVNEEYYGGLSPRELLICWNIKECLKPSSSLPAIRRCYAKNVDRESKILQASNNIGVQSQWSESVVRTFNQSANLFHSGIALRPAFYKSAKWSATPDGRIRIFSTALMGQPLKGCYTLFKAFEIVKQQFPNAELILAGVNESGIRRSGFCRMLTRFAKKNGFWDSIHQMGPCSAAQLADLYRTSSVFVNPSNWESYSVVTAEAMYIGCPTVAAYSGAMPELGVNNSVLYFPKGDHRICASLIIELLRDPQLANELSQKSIEIGESRQNRSKVASQQVATYNQLMEGKKF